MIEQIEHGDVLEIRLARPPVNAFNGALTGALNDALVTAQGSHSAVVISGRDGLFSAGLDVPELMKLDADGMRVFWRAYFGLLETLARSTIPVATAITGHSPAGGAVVALYGDYRVMARGAYVVGLNETQVGLVVPEVIQRALVRLVGAHRAERLIVAGALLDPETALQHGLVDELADSAEAAVARAIGWCRELLALPAWAMSTNRQMLRASLGALFDGLGEAQVEAFVEGWFRDDTQQVLRGLLERLASKR